MTDKDAIRPIYSELQGCLAQAPEAELHRDISNAEFWEDHNLTIQELNEVTGKDYSKYIFTPMKGYSYQHITVEIYRKKLGGLIARLHAEYFSDEQVPFADMPSTIIHQNQIQSVQIELIQEVTNLIDDKLQAAQAGSKEKTFLEKVRGSLSKVKNISQLIPLIIKTAKEMDISINELCDLF